MLNGIPCDAPYSSCRAKPPPLLCRRPALASSLADLCCRGAPSVLAAAKIFFRAATALGLINSHPNHPSYQCPVRRSCNPCAFADHPHSLVGDQLDDSAIFPSRGPFTEPVISANVIGDTASKHTIPILLLRFASRHIHTRCIYYPNDCFAYRFRGFTPHSFRSECIL